MIDLQQPGSQHIILSADEPIRVEVSAHVVNGKAQLIMHAYRGTMESIAHLTPRELEDVEPDAHFDGSIDAGAVIEPEPTT